jgi:hypothetical protein
MCGVPEVRSRGIATGHRLPRALLAAWECACAEMSANTNSLYQATTGRDSEEIQKALSDGANIRLKVEAARVAHDSHRKEHGC